MNTQRLEHDARSQSVPDAELARAAQRGDKRAFVEIVARHQAMVCGIALGILADFAASEDVGQEAFLTAWRKIHELREPARLRAWLAQIARNAALGHRRSSKPHDPLDEGLELSDGSPTPSEAAATEEEAMLVRQSLAKLPEGYRLPLVLYYTEGQSVRAVAETLGISEDAVKQRLARGREMCRDRISGLIETVLTHKRPTAILTMTIAAAIGALTAPAAVAATVFASSAAASTSATTSAIKTFLATVMSSSKGFLIATAIVAVLCIPIGYQLNTSSVVPVAKLPPVPDATPALPTNPPASFESSALFAEWRALHEQYGTNAQAMPLLYKAVKDLKDSFHRKALGAALRTEWAQVDPAGGLSFFLSPGHGNDERQQFFREWLSIDPHAAVTGLMGSGAEWLGLAHDCLGDIAHAVPDQIPAIVSQLPKAESFWDYTVRDAFAVLAQGGMESARLAAESISGPNRDQALAGVAKAWGRTDLNAAINWAKGLPDGADRDEIIRNALVGKAGVDPAAALDNVNLVPEGGQQMYFASTTGARVLSQAAQTDFDATVAWLSSHPGRVGNEDLMGLADPVTSRLNADPAGFLTAHANDGSLKVLQPAIGSALLNGSAGERGAVWDWLQNQPESEEVKSLKTQVLNSAAWQDPMLALKLGGSLPDTADGNKAVQDLARTIFNGGSMLGRVDQMLANAPDRMQTPLVESAFSLLSSDNLIDPQPWISKLQLLPEADRAKGVESLAKAWATQSPGDAVAWAGTLPTAETQKAAAAGIVNGWATKDALGAADWVSAMPAGPGRDQSTEALVIAAANQYPQQAWQWALSITDTTERDRAATQVVQTMAARDPATVRQWIDSGPFTMDVKQKLYSALQNPGAH